MTREAIGNQTDSGFSTSAVKAGGFVFTTGNIGTDPVTGALPDDIQAQTTNTLENLSRVLEKAGTSLAQLVKVNVYLDDIDADFDAMNEAYRQYLAAHGIDEPPARTTVGWRLPWSLVEMDMVALAPPGPAGQS
jgi:2-iminobutanoate/2-iminopropanoate deaminase